MMPLSAAEVTDLKSALAAGRADVAGWTHAAYLKMADRSTHVTYSAVGHVLKIKGLWLQGDRQDVTSHLSGGWVEKLPTLKDGGRVSFLVHFDKADSTLNLSAGLAAAALAQTKEYFQIIYADGTGIQFTAFVGLEFDQAQRGELLGLVVLDVTGAVTEI